MAESRASVADLDRIALRMPDAVREPELGDHPSYSVHGKAFAFFRDPRKDAVDERGQRLTDVICLRCSGAGDKEALVTEPGSPFFTTPHFEGYNAVLVRASRIHELTVRELAEVVADAWLAMAPRRLAAHWLSDAGQPPD